MRQSQGYLKPNDFWEIPNWVAILRSNIAEADFVIVRNIDEFVNFLNSSDYNYICFSVLEANKKLIREIIEKYTGTATFAVGGYIDLVHYFAGYDNVTIFDTLSHFSALIVGNFKQEYDYSDFKGVKCIPRLTLSTGCRNRCRFCAVDRIVTEVPKFEVIQQIKSFSDLQFKLIYLNDKTFGQNKNYHLLPTILKHIEAINRDFEGVILQTTPKTLKKLSDDFLRASRVKFIELGIESYNDSILEIYKKPSRESDIDEATRRFENLDARLIPNIIIGFPEETRETYQKTLYYIEQNRNLMSHLNIYNLAIYKQADISKKIKAKKNDSDELTLEKSFHQDKECHRWFHNEIFNLGLDILN
jgi:radical SAM superfamily enzyme YgiQ (UPF0313 family)